VTTPEPRDPASGQNEPEELPCRLLNISTSTCRIDEGTFKGSSTVPPLDVASTVVLQPGTVTDVIIQGGAPNLFGTVIVDGARIEVAAP
jgi:hypothetical protein